MSPYAEDTTIRFVVVHGGLANKNFVTYPTLVESVSVAHKKHAIV